MQNNFLQRVKKHLPMGLTCLKTWFTKTEKMFLFLTLFKKLKNKTSDTKKTNENTKVRIIQ